MEVIRLWQKPLRKLPQRPRRRPRFSRPWPTPTDLTKKQVAAVLEALTDEVRKSLGNRGAGVFTVPGLLKIEKKKVPARPAQKNVKNPLHRRVAWIVLPSRPICKVKLRALRKPEGTWSPSKSWNLIPRRTWTGSERAFQRVLEWAERLRVCYSK